jgi:hypothetical protein
MKLLRKKRQIDELAGLNLCCYLNGESSRRNFNIQERSGNLHVVLSLFENKFVT